MNLQRSKIIILTVATTLLLTNCATPPTVDTIKRPYKPIPMPHSLFAISTECQSIVPYTKPLDFPSKYRQDDDSKSLVDTQQQTEYQARTQHINTFAQAMVKQVERLTRNPRDRRSLDCYIQQLSSWADASALLSQDTTKTGIAVRKWTLASLAASYLRLSIAPTQETQKIESWLSKIANQVISEYDLRPVRLRNNHDY